MSEKPGLARRSVTSVGWNFVANIAVLVVGFIRSVLLARMLPIEVFGVYALASSIVVLTSPLPRFGMGGAFLHRSTETSDEDRAASVQFTLKLLFTAVWLLMLSGGAVAFAEGQVRQALLILAIIHAGIHLTQTSKLILMRRVVHRRLALLSLMSTLLGTAVALALAWKEHYLWALLSTDLVLLAVTVWLLFLPRPVWKPRLAWSNTVVRYYLRFGGKNLVAGLLSTSLDRIDDIWTGIFLGNVSLSYYSRAYRFATYPRSIVAKPINQVTGGTYAELKENRQQLSQAFFRVSAMLVRSGFFLGGGLVLIAPEFITLLLGIKWLPMLDAFRLMLVFALLDPLKATVGQLFTAVGIPETVVWARLLQLVVLILGLFILGPKFGITGVAVAVDIMAVVGIGVLYWKARSHVDFSPARLFAVPTLALVCGFVLSLAAASVFQGAIPSWWTLTVKLTFFTLGFATILLLLERQQLINMVSILFDSFLPHVQESRQSKQP